MYLMLLSFWISWISPGYCRFVAQNLLCFTDRPCHFYTNNKHHCNFSVRFQTPNQKLPTCARITMMSSATNFSAPLHFDPDVIPGAGRKPQSELRKSRCRGGAIRISAFEFSESRRDALLSFKRKNPICLLRNVISATRRWTTYSFLIIDL